MNALGALKKRRALRVGLALGFAVLLLGLVLLQQRAVKNLEYEVSYLVASTTWNVSEVMNETQDLEILLLRLASGEPVHDDVILQFDILWSRVDILLGSEVSESFGIAEICRSYLALLEAVEGELFADTPPDPARLVEIREALAGELVKLRETWIRDHASVSYRTTSLRLEEPRRTSARLQTLTMLLVVGLMLYLALEIWSATRAEIRERELRLAATAADRAKSEFLATLSHEIRTPMNGILGISALLAAEPLDNRQRRFTKTIEDSGLLLMRLIEDILDFARLESDRIELETEATSAEDVIAVPIRMLEPKAAAKGLVLYGRVDPEVPSRFTGDTARLRQVVTNLVDNAIKFTETGEVLVEVRSGEDGGALIFEVTDTGIGIAEDKRQMIFERFVQVDSSSTRRHDGVGLGLAICKRLVTLMGGGIGVRAPVGGGTTIWFSLPLATTTEPPATSPEVPRDLHVLALAETPTAQRILGELLGRLALERVKIVAGIEALVSALDQPGRHGRTALVIWPGGPTLIENLASTLADREGALSGIVFIGGPDRLLRFDLQLSGPPPCLLANPPSIADLADALRAAAGCAVAEASEDIAPRRHRG